MRIDTTNLKNLQELIEKNNELKTAMNPCEKRCYLNANCQCDPTWYGYVGFANAWQQYSAGIVNPVV